MRTVMITGGAGFIGGALCRRLIARGDTRVVNVDLLTYAGVPASLAAIETNPLYHFCRCDIADAAAMRRVMADHAVDRIVHLAAETHVDRSIDAPTAFLRTNVIGTGALLDAALGHWQSLDRERRAAFRFHHVSTDEVFGDADDAPLGHDETSAYRPSSPYSASKASSDHLVGAWHRTFGLPVLLSHAANNYGPRQLPEKLVPLAILNAIEGHFIPLYGDGRQVRDWLHVEDHVDGLLAVLEEGSVGRSYIVATGTGTTNRRIVETVCDEVDRLLGERPEGPRRELIALVADRPGHDRRYTVRPDRIRGELGWQARTPLVAGIAATVRWYVDNEAWWRPLRGATMQRRGLGR